MVRFPADGGEIEAKINRKGSKRPFPRKLDAKQIVLQKVCRAEESWGGTGGEAEEDKLLCVIYEAAGPCFIYLYCRTPPKKQSKLLPQCQNSLLLPVFCAESLSYMQIYKWLDLIGAGGLPECVSQNVN